MNKPIEFLTGAGALASLQEAQRMLDVLDTSGNFTFQTFDDDKDRKSIAFAHIRHGSISDHFSYLSSLNASDKVGIFLAINETDLKGRTAKNVKRVRAVFVDFDQENPNRIELLKQLPLPPTMIVESSPEKHHAYWVVNSGEIALDAFRDLQKTLIQYFAHDGADKSIHDLPRVLRLAGFFHKKYEPFQTRVVHIGQPYSAEEVANWVQGLVPPKQQQQQQQQRQSIGQPNRDTEQRFEDFADEYNRALIEVQSQPEGGRNQMLHEQAVHVFSLVKEGRTKASLEQAKADLTAAALHCGLGISEIETTLSSALGSNAVSTASPEKFEQSKADYLKQKALARGINWVDLTDSGRPKDTIENLEALLNFYGIVCRNNVIKKEPEILIPNKQFFTDTQANDTLAEIISISKRENFSTAHTDQYLNSVCNKNRYNPVLTWVDSKKWDGNPRLGNFLKTVKVQDPKFLSTGEPFHEHLIRKWMIQALASATSTTGMASIGVLVFSGEGGIGKTSWFSNLVPKNLSESLIKTESSLDPHEKDSVLESIRYWIVELGELDGTFKKADIAALKGFITRPRDEVRPPYGRKSDVYGRRTVFCASVNSDSFLVDETGNRRFWTVPTVEVDYAHDFDMQQVWAEVMHLIRSGETFVLNKEATNLLHETNNEHMMADPLADKLEMVFDWRSHKSQWIRKNRNEIFYTMMGRDPNRLEANRLTQLLKNKGLVCKKSNGTRFYEVPPLKNDISDEFFR